MQTFKQWMIEEAWWPWSKKSQTAPQAIPVTGNAIDPNAPQAKPILPVGKIANLGRPNYKTVGIKAQDLTQLRDSISNYLKILGKFRENLTTIPNMPTAYAKSYDSMVLPHTRSLFAKLGELEKTVNLYNFKDTEPRDQVQPKSQPYNPSGVNQMNPLEWVIEEGIRLSHRLFDDLKFEIQNTITAIKNWLASLEKRGGNPNLASRMRGIYKNYILVPQQKLMQDSYWVDEKLKNLMQINKIPVGKIVR